MDIERNANTQATCLAELRGWHLGAMISQATNGKPHSCVQGQVANMRMQR